MGVADLLVDDGALSLSASEGITIISLLSS